MHPEESGVDFGLPPPTRGIRPAGVAPLALDWSTPAHAGNTERQCLKTGITTVYPRPRGEYEVLSIIAMMVGGLPPPTRGIRLQIKAQPLAPGSTPAHAGNTNRTPQGRSSVQVYPRPRGEYGYFRCVKCAGTGLPPPTRGIQI